MFGKKKRDRREEEDFLPEDPEGYDSYPEEEEYPAEYAEEYPEEDAGYDDSGAGPDGIYDNAYDEGTDGEYPEEEEPEKPEPRSIFRPDVRKPYFVLSVLVNTVRVLLLVAVLAGIAGLGALVGIAKAMWTRRRSWTWWRWTRRTRIRNLRTGTGIR